MWQALTDPAFSRQYFFGFAVDVEPKAGGAFFLRYPEWMSAARWWHGGRCAASPALIEGVKDFAQLPEYLVTYDIKQAGDSVRLTMTEAHSWDVPEAILSGGRGGWPAILSSLKSLLEMGKPLAIKMETPKEILEALKPL